MAMPYSQMSERVSQANRARTTSLAKWYQSCKLIHELEQAASELRSRLHTNGLCWEKKVVRNNDQ